MGFLATAAAIHDAVAEPLAWAVVVTFLAGALAEYRSRETARTVFTGAWLLFAVFWAVQTPHFAFTQRSIVEGVGSLVAVPASAYVGYLLAHGRDSLFVMSRAVAVMGLVFMPFEAIPVLQGWLVETVTRQTEWLMGLLGHHPDVVSGAQICAEGAPQGCAEFYPDRRSTFYFEPADSPRPVTYTILLACTGIGSIAIFVGLIAAVRAPFDRKLRALAVSVPVIYVLNLVRNVFISVSFGHMRLQIAPELVASLFGFSLGRHPAYVSYYVADRLIAQSLSVVALLAITFLVVRELPEVLVVVEDVLYVVTGTEYDLSGALDVTRPFGTAADGTQSR